MTVLRLICITFMLAATLLTTPAEAREVRSVLSDAETQKNFGSSYLRQGKYEDATNKFKKCIELIEGVLATDASWRTKQLPHLSSGPTVGELLETCKASLKEAQQGEADQKKEESAAGRRELSNTIRAKWQPMTEAFAAAKRLLSSKKRFDALDADQHLSAVNALASEVAGSVRTTLRSYPALAGEQIEVGGTKIDAAQLPARADEMLEQSQALQTQHAKAIAAARQAWDKAAKSEVAGDRAKIMKQRGLPTWWDNLHNRPTENLAALKAAAWWRYDRSDGCSFTYRFKGNKLLKVEPSRLGCKH
jgi:tetratricopeptide (TPR) repeat protein